MPNTLTTIFTSTPASEPVESPHPNTGVYVLGTQLGNGTWQVIHTLVSKTTTPPTITGRLKNFPAVAASVVASGNVLNNVLAQPTGTSAVATSASAINVTVSSNPNATAYRLLSATTAGGTYAQIYQGAAAGFAHTGLTAGTTCYYEWQYVGGGYYDDSVLSAGFSGLTTADVVSNLVVDSAAKTFTFQPAAGKTAANYAASATFTPPTPPAPTLNALSISSGAVGARVTLTGTSFTGATSVTFNGVATPVTVVSASNATATVPSGATSGPVVLTTPSGVSNSLAFTVTAAAPAETAVYHTNTTLITYAVTFWNQDTGSVDAAYTNSDTGTATISFKNGLRLVNEASAMTGGVFTLAIDGGAATSYTIGAVGAQVFTTATYTDGATHTAVMTKTGGQYFGFRNLLTR